VVLVVDDEPSFRLMLTRVLEWNGFDVLEASHGTEAVHLFQQWHEAIAVALLDLRLPGMDGAMLLGALRAIDPRVPCCVMSGSLGEYTPEQLLEAGALQVFSKPIPLDQLIDTLKALTRRPQSA
jgi:CheY-like chemotaxis protein